jgi:hypothetical protein
VKRVDIYYDGSQYSLADRSPDDVKAEIDAGIASGKPYWLKVNLGLGTLREAELLITGATPVVVVGRPAEE